MDYESVTLPSDDDEGSQDCMPKILTTISLQGCSGVSFQEQSENGGVDSALYPECEIKEENEANKDIKIEPIENGVSHGSKEREGKIEQGIKTEKKRVKLTQLSTFKMKREPSTSRRDDVVDARRLALQESLFKTKELFDTFLRVCQDHENTEQMERVVEKLGRAYDATKQEFLGSPAFQNILEAETEKVNTSNTKPWLNLKLVLDELKHNKKRGGAKLKLGESEESQDAGGSNDDEPIIECPKKRRHLKKLEKVLRAINLKIKKLEEQEVEWDAEDNSAYCKLDRYRDQFTKIYSKICEIKGKLPDADRPYLRKVSFAGTTYPHINRCIEKYYNKHREFPDFQDIKKLVTLALKQEGIEMQPIKIHSMAAAAFKEFGEMLKRLRQYDDYDVLISYLDQQVDPARDDEQLQELLNQNALLFKKREQEVIDKFAEKESAGGLHSESEQDSDSKPKKKKKKIIIKTPNFQKMTNSSAKQDLLGSGSSDEEDKHPKPKTSVGLSSDSDNSSDSEKPSVKGKGKALVGKQRIVKKGVKKSPDKSLKPKTAISSDEETVPKNTKESLTNYLGLQGRKSPNTTKIKESIKLSESEDEITCIDEIQMPEEESREKKRNAFSENSDIKTTKQQAVTGKSDSSYSSTSSLKDLKDLQIKCNIIADSDSDVEPIAIVNTSKGSIGSVNKSRNQTIKRTGQATNSKKVPTPRTVSKSKIDKHETISDSSESENRTSDEESESGEKKSLSDVELSTGTKDLSSDSSDEIFGEKKDKNVDTVDTIVILSEDITEDPKPAPQQNLSKHQEASSDSDDVCILSQVEAERRTVAPRKMKPNSGAISSSSTPRKRGVVTSTPTNSPNQPMKRRLSSQSNNGNNAKMRRLGANVNDKQATLPQIINGASRKILISRVPKSRSSSGTTTLEPIPLIEID